MNIKLYRFMYESDDQGTPGILIMQGFHCVTLELPWRDNKTSISCIPKGKYEMKKDRSNRILGGRRDLYLLKDTLPRTRVFIHAGNWAGDKAMGFVTNSYGCILLGSSHTKIDGQKAISNSQNTMRDFMDELGGMDADLEILEV